MTVEYETVAGETELWRGRQWVVATFCIQCVGNGDYGYWISLAESGIVHRSK